MQSTLDAGAGSYRVQEVTSGSVHGALENISSELGAVSDIRLSDNGRLVEVVTQIGQPVKEVLGSVNDTAIRITCYRDDGFLSPQSQYISLQNKHEFIRQGDRVYYNLGSVDGETNAYHVLEVASVEQGVDRSIVLLSLKLLREF